MWYSSHMYRLVFYVYSMWMKFCYYRMLEEVIDDAGAMIVTRYLSSFRSLSKSFDFYLLQVIGIVHLYIHACVCICILCACVRVYMCVCTCVCTCVCACMCVYMCACVWVHVCVHICACMCDHVCICVCVYYIALVMWHRSTLVLYIHHFCSAAFEGIKWTGCPCKNKGNESIISHRSSWS